MDALYKDKTWDQVIEEFFARHSEQYVQETFGGSLPAFMAAFGTRKKLTDSEIDEMKKLIESMRR